MSSWISHIHQKLLNPTPFFHMKLWITIILCICIAIVLASSIAFYCCLIHRHYRKAPVISRSASLQMMNKSLLSRYGWDMEMCIDNGIPEKEVKFYRPSYDDIRAGGKEFMLNEIELATDFFSDRCVIGCGEHRVVYRGVLLDHTRVAVKKLLFNRARLQDLAREAGSLWCLQHRNLVKFLGYCTEGMFSFLVWEYVDNGNLYQWLHERTCKRSWKIRMEIIQGIAKGLAYLHEDSEASICHQHLKSSNILLDKQWNPKISDFGLSRFLPHRDENGDLSGYVAPEEYGNGFEMDVYSFGVLVMEIVSGRTPMTETEEYLVDWMKTMVSKGDLSGILDPKLPEFPSQIELKRVALIALRCVDSDAGNRPKMGDVVHMLEPLDLLLSDNPLVHFCSLMTPSFSRLLQELNKGVLAL